LQKPSVVVEGAADDQRLGNLDDISFVAKLKLFRLTLN